jgi:hypothetical protein
LDVARRIEEVIALRGFVLIGFSAADQRVRILCLVGELVATFVSDVDVLRVVGQEFGDRRRKVCDVDDDVVSGLGNPRDVRTPFDQLRSERGLFQVGRVHAS